MKAQKAFIEITYFLYISMLLYAAVSKLLRLDEFRVQMIRQPFPDSFAPMMIWIIPSIELVIVLQLLIPRLRLIGLYAATILMSLFSIYIGYILSLSSAEIPCSCGGAIEKLTWGQHLIFNILFVVLGAISIILEKRNNQNMILSI